MKVECKFVHTVKGKYNTYTPPNGPKLHAMETTLTIQVEGPSYEAPQVFEAVKDLLQKNMGYKVG